MAATCSAFRVTEFPTLNTRLKPRGRVDGPPTLATFVRRGLVAGAAGGIANALVLVFLGEASIRKAIAIESARPQDAHASHAAEVTLSRGTQQVGGVIAGLLYGLLLGAVFAIVFAAIRHRVRLANDARRAVALGAAAFLALVVVPSLKYPANPPAVGNPDTIGARTFSYLTLMAFGIVLVIALWMLGRTPSIAAWPEALRWLVVALVAVAATTGAYLIWRSPDPLPADVPAGLIWRFRLASLGGLLALWTVLSGTMALLCTVGLRQRAASST